jgi:hypothetical protein
LASLSRLNDFHFLEEKTRGLRRWPAPSEAFGLWDLCFPGFSQADWDWDEQLLNEAGAAKLKRLIITHLRWHGKKRFLTKYTGLPRLRFVRAIFPDACFIYIDRDPRAVVFSYMKQKWGFKDKPHVLEAMPMRTRLELYAERYLKIYRAKQMFQADRDYIQLYYEQLVENPVAKLREICELASLPLSDVFDRRIMSWNIERETNEMWRQLLQPGEQAYLAELLAQPLAEMGYATPEPFSSKPADMANRVTPSIGERS